MLQSAKASLLETAQSLQDNNNSLFLVRREDRKTLEKAVAELEVCLDDSSSYDAYKAAECLLEGDWELVCTTNSNSVPRPPSLPFLASKKKKLPSFLNPMDFKKEVKDSIQVVQRIRNIPSSTETSSSTIINRVDNVIEFDPSKISFIPNILEVSTAKAVLIHDAKVESVSPVLRTKIDFKAIVFNVAGQSQSLDPNGADVFGINALPIADFMNVGYFDTIYVDETLRVSRGPGVTPFDEQIRIFTRRSTSSTNTHDGEMTPDEGSSTSPEIVSLSSNEDSSDNGDDVHMETTSSHQTDKEENIDETVDENDETVEDENTSPSDTTNREPDGESK